MLAHQAPKGAEQDGIKPQAASPLQVAGRAQPDGKWAPEKHA